jgi:oligopeptidase B
VKNVAYSGLIQEVETKAFPTSNSVPLQMGSFYFSEITDEHGNSNMYRASRPDMLDKKKIVSASDYYNSILRVQFSQNGRTAGLFLNENYGDSFTLQLICCDSGSKLGSIANVASAVLTPNGQRVLYTKVDSLHQWTSQVWMHDIGTSANNDQLVFEETDRSFYLHVSQSNCQPSTLLISSMSKTAAEVLAVDEDTLELQCIQSKDSGVQGFVDRTEHYWYLVNNQGHPEDYQLSRKRIDDVHSSWEHVFSPPPNVFVEDLVQFPQAVVFLGREGLAPCLIVLDLVDWQAAPTEVTYLYFPSHITSALFHHCQWDLQHTQHVVVTGSSPVQPPSHYRFSLDQRVLEAIEIEEEDENEKEGTLSPHSVYREYALADNGTTRIPITLVAGAGVGKVGLKQNQNAPPLLFTCYGAYGHPVDTSYRSYWQPWLDRGGIIAFAHIRGGGELGLRWHNAGSGMNKIKSVEDSETSLIHCQELLGISAQKTAVLGVSAGAIAIAGLCERQPQRMRCAVLRLPFLDVLNAMLDDSVPLNAHEQEEFGNPRSSAAALDAILSIDPYYNLPASLKRLSPLLANDQDNCLSHMLISTAMNDSRVPAWIPLKFLARIRKAQQEDPILREKLTVLLQVIESGHNIYTGDSMKEMGFILQALKS